MGHACVCSVRPPLPSALGLSRVGLISALTANNARTGKHTASKALFLESLHMLDRNIPQEASLSPWKAETRLQSLPIPCYLPTTRMENESGTRAPRTGRPPGCAGAVDVPNSAPINKIRLVLESSVLVLAAVIV